MSSHAETPLNWSELGVSGLLPTGTVTLLLADVEGSTRLWQTQPEEMTAAVARLDQAVSDVIAAHDGVRPVEQGEGDSFVVAFARAADAVACALELQRAPLAPIRLRIGVHTGDVQLRACEGAAGRPSRAAGSASAWVSLRTTVGAGWLEKNAGRGTRICHWGAGAGGQGSHSHPM
jgi:class 3 adenylate cyclase